MKKALLLLTVFLVVHVHGQDTLVISGTITDSGSLAPVAAARIVLLTWPDQQPVQSVVTDTSGTFRLVFTPLKQPALTISCTGYRSRTVRLPEDSLLLLQPFVLPPVLLSPDQEHLAAVTVRAMKPLIRQEVDRLSYEVQTDPDQASLSLLELLRKVPLLSVDGEDNIRLKGSGHYRVFVNGRPSTLFAGNPKEALKAMPAGAVKKIEVITTPPARYDAEGLAGIINLVLNKRLVDGYNASVGLSYNNTVGTGQNLVITGKKGKLGITGRAYLFQDFRRHLQNRTERHTLYPVPSVLTQAGDYAFVGSYFSENIELSYDADSLNLLTAAVNFTNSRYEDETRLLAVTKNGQQEVVQAYQSLNLSPQRNRGLTLNANYQKGFRNRPGRLLTLSYQYQYAPGRLRNELSFQDRFNYPVADYLQDNHSHTREQTLQLDYVRPSAKLGIEGGLKGIFRENNCDFTSRQPVPNGSDPGIHHQLLYHQQVYSMYAAVRRKFKQLELQTGWRLEHTRVDADFMRRTSQLQMDYTNLIPVVSIQHRLSKGAVNLSYTQRINRPGIYELNPFTDRSNPAFASTGNPGLEAVLKNSIELAFSRYGKGNLNINTSYAFSGNTIQQVTTLTDSIAYTSYRNTGSDRSIGLNISAAYPFGKSWSANLNGELNYTRIEGVFQAVDFKNEGLQGYAYAQLSYAISATWRTTVSATFIGPTVFLQGSTNGYVHNAFRISKDLLRRKLTVAMSVNNPYSRYRYVKTRTTASGFSQQQINQRLYRSFSLNINYHFGQLATAIRKNQRSISNDDLKTR